MGFPATRDRASADPTLAPAEVSLGPGSARVEVVILDLLDADLAGLESHLSPDEIEVARRFRFNQDRRRYVAARGGLRTLLAARLGLAPGEVRFSYGPSGKPTLAPNLAESGIRFNVSHSGPFGLCALTRGLEVGIDIEQVRSSPDLQDVAEHFFAPSECAVLRRLPLELRQEAFFRCWTRKEAYLKGRGDGLSMPLDSFQVSLAPGEPARLLRVVDRPADVERWSLSDVAVPEGYAGALAVARPSDGPHSPTVPVEPRPRAGS